MQKITGSFCGTIGFFFNYHPLRNIFSIPVLHDSMDGNRWDRFSGGKRVEELYYSISSLLLLVGVGGIYLVVVK